MRNYYTMIRRRMLPVLLLVSALFLTTVTAAERANYLKADPYKHNLQELANVAMQIVIDSSWAYATLDSGEVCTTAWIEPQTLFRTYGNLATYVIDLDSGSVSVRFEKFYWQQMGIVGAADSSACVRDEFGQIKWTTSAPLNITGQWDADVPVLGGKKFRLFVTAHSEGTGFRHGIQLMRSR